MSCQEEGGTKETGSVPFAARELQKEGTVPISTSPHMLDVQGKRKVHPTSENGVQEKGARHSGATTINEDVNADDIIGTVCRNLNEGTSTFQEPSVKEMNLEREVCDEEVSSAAAEPKGLAFNASQDGINKEIEKTRGTNACMESNLDSRRHDAGMSPNQQAKPVAPVLSDAAEVVPPYLSVGQTQMDIDKPSVTDELVS